MEKFIYNDKAHFQRIEIEESFENEIINRENKKRLEFFQLYFTEDLILYLVKEGWSYYERKLIKEFGNNYKDIILSKKEYNSLPYLYVNKGINSCSILLYIGIKIFMGMYKLRIIDDYWKTDKFIEYKFKDIMRKNYFKLISKALHVPIKDDNNENDNNVVTVTEDKIEDQE